MYLNKFVKKVILLSMGLCFICPVIFPQTPIIPKETHLIGNYKHEATGAIFPVSIDDFSRTGIWLFDDEKTNVGVNYANTVNGKTTTLSIYIYPAGRADEDRLRNEYLLSLQSVISVLKKGYSLKQDPVFYPDSGYNICGFRGEVKYFKEKTILSVYECGRWFFKIRISTLDMNSNQLQNLETTVLSLFAPTRFVREAPLEPNADIFFSKAAFTDSLMLGCNMGCALAKIEWVQENVDSLQRISGFPGLYLNMYMAGFDEFLKFAAEHPKMKRSYETDDYLSDLKSLRTSGYLDEFIMEQFKKVMISPENSMFDFDGYHEWIKLHPVNIDLHKKFYVLVYTD
jgi:hypothetical protein